MTNKTILLFLAINLLTFMGCDSNKKITELKNEDEKAAYAIGLNIGNSLKVQKLNNFDINIISQGISDAVNDEKMLINKDSINGIINDYMKKKFESLSTENNEKAEKFFAENKEKDGVITTDSGLQYKVIREGEGEKPKNETDYVTVDYEGKLLDNSIFDSSYQRGEPAKFPLNGLIKGWTEGLMLMKKGAKYRLFIPPSLAYGQAGAGAKIGPNSALIFDVELIEIQTEEEWKKEIESKNKKENK